jgi:hypothetical protein
MPGKNTDKYKKQGGEGKETKQNSSNTGVSNVFNKTPETIPLITHPTDVKMGIGTDKPSCKLSFGKNTSFTFDDEKAQSSIPGICFNEEKGGTDATGITFYERIDETNNERSEAGIAFVVSNENYDRSINNSGSFKNNMDVSKNKIIPMSILSRTTGHTTVLVNHDPAQTTERATFGNVNVSVDISGAIRTNKFLILGSDGIDTTDFNDLNPGTLYFDGTKCYIQQKGTDQPTELLLKNDATAGTSTTFTGVADNGAIKGIYQTENTIFTNTGEQPLHSEFNNKLAVIGNTSFGKNKDYIKKGISLHNDSVTEGIISVQTAIGINMVDSIAAAIHADCSGMPYIIMGSAGLFNDISENTVTFGDNNSANFTKSTIFGDVNSIQGTYSFNIGSNNNIIGDNCFIQGNNNENTGSNKSIIFGEQNNLKNTEQLTNPGKNQHNFVAGYKNILRDGSSNFIFGTKIDTSGVSYSTAFGYNADVSNNIRFAIGTEELDGNAFTMDISGNIKIEGNIDCITNEDKGIFESCSENITIGNADTLTVFPGEVSNYSDERLKFNIEPIENSLSAVCKLKGVRYNRNDSNNDKKHIGLIAQEVEKIVPEVVNTGNTPDHLLSINYGNLVSLLIESIKELNSNVETLKQENTSLKTDVEMLKEQMKEVLRE